MKQQNLENYFFYLEPGEKLTEFMFSSSFLCKGTQWECLWGTNRRSRERKQGTLSDVSLAGGIAL